MQSNGEASAEPIVAAKKIPTKRKATPKKTAAKKEENDNEPEEPTTPKPSKKRTPNKSKKEEVKTEVISSLSEYKISVFSLQRPSIKPVIFHSLTTSIRPRTSPTLIMPPVKSLHQLPLPQLLLPRNVLLRPRQMAMRPKLLPRNARPRLLPTVMPRHPPRLLIPPRRLLPAPRSSSPNPLRSFLKVTSCWFA